MKLLYLTNTKNKSIVRESIRSRRIAWIDNVRAFAIILVVLEHSLSKCEYGDSIVRWIISFDMPLFVIISGYCAYHTFNKSLYLKDIPLYIEKTTRHILLPALMGTLTVLMLNQLQKAHIQNSFICLFAGITAIIIFINKDKNRLTASLFKCVLLVAVFVAFYRHTYWFLTMIWSVLVLFRTLMTVFKKRFLFVILSILVLAFAVSYYLDNWCYISEFFLYFLVGLLLYKYQDLHLIYYAVLTTCLLIGVETYFISDSNISFYSFSMTDLLLSDNWYYWVMRQVGAISWSILFIKIFKSASSRYSGFSWLGGATIGMYVLQGIFITIMQNIESRIGITNQNWLAVCFPIFIGCVWISILIINFFEHYKLTRTLFLGKAS